MPIFAYKGMGADGKAIAGSIDAESDKAARSKLRKQRIMVTKIAAEAKRGGFSNPFGGVSVSDVAQMTRQMSVLLSANIPLLDTLESLQQQLQNPILKNAMGDIKGKVAEGARVADCMAAYPNIFGNIFIHMIRAGEASGQLETVLNRLADYTESQAKLRAKMKSAMMYPSIMMLVCVGLVSYLLISVVPKILGIFAKNKDMVLPLPTRILVGATDFMQNYWWLLLIGTAAAIFAFLAWKKTPSGQKKVDSLKLRLPVFGKLNLLVAVSRFSRTLSTLLKSGVQLLQALDIVKNVMDNVILSAVVEETMANVKEGESLAMPLRRSALFPVFFIQMIETGEKTGALDTMLETVAKNYDGEVETAVDGMTSVLEPVMLVVMGGVVGFIVMAIMMPIMQMSQMAKH